MNFFKKIFGKKDEPIKSYIDFWNWFMEHEKDFFNVVKSANNIEANFLDKLSPKVAQIKDGFYFLTGMLDVNTAELIITADGIAKNIVFVEELIAHAPSIEGWKFTALKPAVDIEKFGIDMAGYEFSNENMFFYENSNPLYPDSIDISIVHDEYNQNNKERITSGVYIFLDNYLGELNFLNIIDDLQLVSKTEAKRELVPISKLKDFLTWQQKEFVEKYEGVRYNTESDEYALLRAQLANGNMIIASVNNRLLNWEAHASHPWIAVLNIKFDGNNNGMPDNINQELLNAIEDEIMTELIDKDGFLNVARQTANNERQIFFACKDFRKPSKVYFHIQTKFGNKYQIDFDIYKDKYWRTFAQFNQK